MDYSGITSKSDAIAYSYARVEDELIEQIEHEITASYLEGRRITIQLPDSNPNGNPEYQRAILSIKEKYGAAGWEVQDQKGYAFEWFLYLR